MIRQDLIDLYHEYLGVTKNQPAAACLCILDMLDRGAVQSHTLVTGEATRQDFQIQALPEQEVERQLEKLEEKDEWAKLLDAYLILKKTSRQAEIA